MDVINNNDYSDDYLRTLPTKESRLLSCRNRRKDYIVLVAQC